MTQKKQKKYAARASSSHRSSYLNYHHSLCALFLETQTPLI
jgi:hypothetical protein